MRSCGGWSLRAGIASDNQVPAQDSAVEYHTGRTAGTFLPTTAAAAAMLQGENK